MIWPKSPDLTRIACEFLFHVAEIGKPGFDPRDVVDFWDVVNRQDWAICERQQKGVDSSAYEPGPYSTFKEYNVDAFVRWYVKMLAAGASAC